MAEIDKIAKDIGPECSAPSLSMPVLKDISFHAEPSRVVPFVGPTGTGKTTMINVLGKFYDIQGGSIKIDGIDIRDLNLESLRRQLGTPRQFSLRQHGDGKHTLWQAG